MGRLWLFPREGDGVVLFRASGRWRATSSRRPLRYRVAPLGGTEPGRRQGRNHTARMKEPSNRLVRSAPKKIECGPKLISYRSRIKRCDGGKRGAPSDRSGNIEQPPSHNERPDAAGALGVHTPGRRPGDIPVPRRRKDAAAGLIYRDMLICWRWRPNAAADERKGPPSIVRSLSIFLIRPGDQVGICQFRT